MTSRMFIRVDMGGEYGLGHAKRCLALAKALKARGAEVLFLTTTPALAAFVTGFPCLPYGEPTLYATDSIVVDTKGHDAVEAAFMGSLRDTLGSKVVSIDDPLVTPETCDLLIGPCVHWSPATVQGLQAAFGTRFLYGWDYVMLDDEVTSHAPIPYEERQEGPIVLCAGGSDPSMALEKMVRWSGELPKNLSLRFAIPQHARHAYSLTPWGEWMPFSRHLLREAALVVSMFGVTCYETLWYQTPLLMLSHADENDWGAFYLGRASSDAARRLGPLAAHTAATFTEALLATWNSPYGRPYMHTAAAGLMDGQGIARIATAILELL